MRFLICSDGMPASRSAIRIGGLLAAACRAETVLLGITEHPADDAALKNAIEEQGQSIQREGVSPKLIFRAGEPIREILNETAASSYDLVIIGAQQKGRSGLYWRSAKTYEVVKAITAPVLVAIGQCAQLKKFLVCTG